MAIALVSGQKAMADTDISTGTTLGVAFPGNTTTGNLLVVNTGNDDSDNTNAVDSVACTGATFSINQVSQWSTTPYQRVDGHYAANITGAATPTVTATWSPARGWRHIHISEWSGVDTSTPLDKTGSGTGTGTVYTTSSQTTTTNGQLIYVAEGNGSSPTVGTSPNFTQLGIGVNYGNYSEYLIQSSAGAIIGEVNGASSDYVTIMMTFKAAAAAGVPFADPLMGQIWQ
jgi:hypothetical protein